MTDTNESNSKPSQPVQHSGELGLEAGQAAVVLGADVLRDDEIVILLLRPSMWYIPLSSFGSLVVIGLITLLFAYLDRFDWTGWNDTQAFMLGIGLAALRLGWQGLEWYSRVYVLTDRRVIRRMGVLRYSVFEAALGNIQHTSIFASIRERTFALGSIGFATSGSDFFDAYWVMVRSPHKVHKRVMETIERYGRNGRG